MQQSPAILTNPHRFANCFRFRQSRPNSTSSLLLGKVDYCSEDLFPPRGKPPQRPFIRLTASQVPALSSHICAWRRSSCRPRTFPSSIQQHLCCSVWDWSSESFSCQGLVELPHTMSRMYTTKLSHRSCRRLTGLFICLISRNFLVSDRECRQS